MSTVQVSNITDGTNSVETVYVARGSAKAWVNFNGTGTIAARDSLNLSSLTDNGTGDYTVNFSSAMADANYSPLSVGAGGTPALTNYGVGVGGPYITSPTASAFRIYVSTPTSLYDATHVSVGFNGDLA